MALGSFAAIGQTNIKRLMAYSSIGHMGFALVGLAAGTVEGAHGVIVYMAIYLAMTLGTFAGILSMRRDGAYVEDIADLAGLARTNAPMAFFLAAMMFSLAGVPPLAGFFAKFYVFAAAMKADLYGLADHRRAAQRGQRLLLSAHRQDHVFRRAGQGVRPSGLGGADRARAVDGGRHLLRVRAGAADRRRDGRGEVAVLNAIDFQADPKPLFAGWRVARFARVGSTNDEARRSALAGDAGRLWVVAEEQTHGRGRKGRFWSSPPGNLYASALVVDPCPPALAPQIGFVAGVALAQAVEDLGGVGFGLKWPNDLMWRGAKIAGLLAEGVTTPDRRLACIVGIGVNCVSAPDGLDYPAASLSDALRAAGLGRRAVRPAGDALPRGARPVGARRWLRRHSRAMARQRGGARRADPRRRSARRARRRVRRSRRGRPAAAAHPGGRRDDRSGRSLSRADGRTHWGGRRGKPAIMSDANELVFAPLGGLGEIGMNCALYGFGPPRARKWLMVDVGLAFAGDDLPGVDLLMPDIAFIEKAKKDLVGIIVTHAHEDHIGALAELWPRLGAPVYMTRFSAGLAEARRLSEPGAPKIPITIVAPGGRLDIGPFNVEFVPVAHSIPESCALAIRTPAGVVVHTGDWKIDPTPPIGAADRRAPPARDRRRGRAGADLRFDQRAARRRQPVGGRRRRDARRTGARNARPRLRHHLRFERRAAARRGRGGLRRRTAGDGARPRDGARRRGGARMRLSSTACRRCSAPIGSTACRATRSSRSPPAARANRAPRWRAWRSTSASARA